MHKTTLFLSVVGLTFSPPALAQANDDVGAQDDIIVTALKRDQKLQDVPATVNVLTSEAIADRQIGSMEDLQSQVAGLKFDPISGNSNISIRGIGTTFTTGAGENSVSLHLDGIYLSSPRGASMGQFDLGGVEVLRGPQGTLYGKNSTAGIVNFISAAPTETFEAGVTAGYGNYDRKKLEGYVSGPLSNTVRARLYAGWDERDNYSINLTTGQGLDDLRSFSGRLGIDADIKPGWDMELRLTGRREKYHGPAFQPYSSAGLMIPFPLTITTPRKLNSDVIFDGERDIILASMKNTFAIGGVTLVSLTGFSRLNVDDNGYDALAQYHPLLPLSLPLTYHLKATTASQEFNLKGQSGSLDWLFGTFYYFERQQVDSTLFLSMAVSPFGVEAVREGNSKFDRHSASIFADGTFSISDTTRLFAGVRGLYEHAGNDLDVAYKPATGGPAFFNECSAGAPLQRVGDWSATGRIGLQHDVGEDAMVYGQASRGYKSGGFSNNTCNNKYAPETVNAFEIGVKSQFMDRRVTLNASAYYYDYSNVAVEQSTVTGTSVVNAPKSHVLGLDLDGRFQLTQWLSVDGNATFLKTAYDRFFSSGGLAYGDPDGTDLSGRRLNKAPGASGTLGVNVDLPVGDGNLKLRGEGYFSGGYRLREYTSAIFRQKSYELFNAYLTYSPSDSIDVRLFGKNLSKTDYLQGTVAALAGANGVFNPPRTYGIELTVKTR